MEIVLNWITHYGYFGMFGLLVLGIVGLPVPDEMMLTFAGYLVYKGQLQLVPTLAAGFLGSVCGITLSYILGRATGYFLIEKFGAKLHIKMDRVHQVHDWFHRLGRFTLTIGYYIPGVRHLTAYVAGASELEAPIFAIFAYLGAFLWSASFITLGYFLGENWEKASDQVHGYLIAAIAVSVSVAALYWLWRRRRRPA
ncbi:MAG TPA: DedA family protein [Bryobacteraceae bacterium]|nr:DedA family protein [Bryobacteraceae bacterium]